MSKFLRRYYNLPVVIEKRATVDESTQRGMRVFLICLGTFLVLLLYLYLNVAVTTTGYELKKLEAEHRRASSMHGYLSMELNRRANLKEIEEKARRDYGFVDSFQAREIVVPRGEKERPWWRFWGGDE